MVQSKQIAHPTTVNHPDSSVSSDVRGIDLGHVVVMLAHGKIVINAKSSPEHLTIHFGLDGREIDVHRTHQFPGGTFRHERLFAITHANFEALMQEMAPLLFASLADLWRPLRPGWMARNRMAAVIGLVPPEAEWPKVTGVRKKRIYVDAEKLKGNARLADNLQELFELPDGGAFTVFSSKRSGAVRMMGIGLKKTDEFGHPGLIWIKNRDVAPAFKRIESEGFAAARKYGTVHVEPPWL